METFNLIEPEWASLLLHFWPLGDTKPSSLMDEMLALLGDHPPCFLFQQLFLEHLPEDMHTQLIDTNIGDCRQLAQRADRIWAARQMRSYANNVQTEPAPTPEHRLLVASNVGHEACTADTVQRCPQTQKETAPYSTQPLLLPPYVWRKGSRMPAAVWMAGK